MKTAFLLGVLEINQKSLKFTIMSPVNHVRIIMAVQERTDDARGLREVLAKHSKHTELN